MSRTATYSLIASNTLGSAAADVTFSSIPATFTDLILVTQHTCATGSNNQLAIRPNSDSSYIYSRTFLTGDGSTASSSRFTGEQAIFPSYVGNNTDLTNVITQFMDYSNTTTFKTILSRTNAANYPRAQVTLWRSTTAITSLYIYPYSGTFATGSVFKLYGIQAGNA
jgi:hypothetical protein